MADFVDARARDRVNFTLIDNADQLFAGIDRVVVMKGGYYLKLLLFFSLMVVNLYGSSEAKVPKFTLGTVKEIRREKVKRT